MVQVKALDCPNCGASIPDTSKACGHCGSRVILSDDRQKFVLAGTICPKCGLDNKEQYRFCSKCGDKLFKECPKCHKEIGLESIHCPFCGDNIDNAATEKEIALAKRTYSLSQMVLLQQKLELLGVEFGKINQQLNEAWDTWFHIGAKKLESQRASIQKEIHAISNEMIYHRQVISEIERQYKI